jgi:hypothetical protein
MNKTIILWTVLVIVLIGVAGLIGFRLGLNKSDRSQVAGITADRSNSQTPQSSAFEATIALKQSTISGQISQSEQLVNSFYRFYINCLNQKQDCSYQNRPDVDYQQLMEKTREVKGYDRILCAQNIPDFFQIDHSTKESDSLESVYVVENFSQGQVQLIVEVEKSDSGPKIINVICPRP